MANCITRNVNIQTKIDHFDNTFTFQQQRFQISYLHERNSYTRMSRAKNAQRNAIITCVRNAISFQLVDHRVDFDPRCIYILVLTRS